MVASVPMKLIGVIWTPVGILIALASALVWGTVFALPVLPVPRGFRERYAIWAAVFFGHTTLRLGFLSRTDVCGRENIPFGSPYMVVSNHRSWVDPILHSCYGRAQGLSKAEIALLPVIGFYAYLTGAVFFDRKSPAARKRAFHEVLMLMHGGGAVHVFPEGTRTRDGAIRQNVHLRLVEACWGDGVPVVPAAVMHTERTMPVSPPIIVPFQRHSVHYLPPVMPADYPDGEAFARAVWDAVAAEVEVMKTQ